MLISVFLIVMSFTQCSDTQTEAQSSSVFSHPNPDVTRILTRAFEKAGGLDKYRHLNTISYTKRSILYDSDGEIESDVTQSHDYRLLPDLEGTIQWQDNGIEHEVQYRDKEGYQYIDGVLKGVGEFAAKSFLSAYYVLFMPFKLADPGVILTYEGEVTLDSGARADVIKAVYEPESNANHSTSDTWWFYFDLTHGDYLASMVHHPPTYALIENTTKSRDGRLVLNSYRRSFRVDDKMEKQFLRGEFYYSDFVMN